VVTIDGDKVGMTPVVLDTRLGDGAHTLKIASIDGQQATRKLSLKKGERFVLVSENLAASGKVRVETRPAGARVFLDGSDVGQSPVSVDRVATDKVHVVEARLDGYAPATGSIPIDRGEVFDLTLPLRSTHGEGSAVFLSTPPAQILMDGQPWGATSEKVRNCPAGTHELTLKAAGAAMTYTVQVPERGNVKYFFDLRSSE
jgi:hypothetical protein